MTSYQFAVFGNPIEQSKSPQIHSRFAQQFNIAMDYRKILSTAELFENDLQEFFTSKGGNGCNVTAPFKEQAYNKCEILTPTAQKARAVNTVYLDEKKRLCGHNSDGAGLVNDLLNNQQVTLAGSNILILGAGGATRGILEPVIAQQPASIILANRTVEKAEQLSREFSDLYKIHTTSTENPQYPATPDLLINATSASLTANLPVSDRNLVGPATVCYDLAYKQEPTAFLNWAADCGAAKTIDGKGMLAEQAAISFEIWTRHRPATSDVITWLGNN